MSYQNESLPTVLQIGFNLLNKDPLLFSLSRQSWEIRDLLKCKSRLEVDKVNDFKGLKSCKTLML